MMMKEDYTASFYQKPTIHHTQRAGYYHLNIGLK
jgi:hypothetical protein